MLETITLKEVIQCFDRGDVFTIGFRTFDKRKNEGGEYVEIPQACKYGTGPGTTREGNTTSPRELVKDPQHYANSTRNLKCLEDGRIIKVHLRLIFFFNSKVVM